MSNEKNEKILDVKDLRISFRTNSGTVKAVRGISFSLYRQKTLCIVGESGSGKSVTSKAILGILSNNKLVEDGEIIYNGNDLLTLPEEKFSKIRGVKISMIFQDPLSALNPIMKVGKQLIEAMYLENKTKRKEAKKRLAELDKLASSHCQAKLSTADEKTFDSLSSQMIEKESALFTEALKESSKLVKEFKNKYLLDKEHFNKKATLKGLKVVSSQLKKSKNKITGQLDNLIDVYSSLIKTNCFKYSEAQSILVQRDELLAKYKVDDVYKLPAFIRAKHREVINEPVIFVDEMNSLTDNLLVRIDEIIDQYSKVTKSDLDSFKKAYKALVDEKNNVLTKEQAKQRALELMRNVGISEPEKRYYQYPFEFSGGMRQRIVIAIALSGNPEILICDEPTTALDVTIQSQILELIQKLKKEKNLSIIFITHDMGVVANMADDIAVMYAGKIVEYGTVYDIFYDPRHPYTWALLGSMPDLYTVGQLDAIPGTPPNMLLPPKGDAFEYRNKYAVELDDEQEPPFFEISPTHYAKTWLLHENAPDVEAPEIVKERIYNSLDKNKNNMPSYTLKKNSILNGYKK